MSTLEQSPTLTRLPSPRVSSTAVPVPEIVYPESDGMPMADNTEQFDYIVKIHAGIAWQFHDDPDVFVAGDLLWYPVEGDNKTRVAPDVLVAFGRPKGYRGSYLQWREGGIAPQVVFEIVSPNNTRAEMARKLRFYERYGVEEYYLFDPQRDDLAGWLRQGDDLVPIETMEDWVSPRLGATFHLTPEGDLDLHHPDGQPFASVIEANLRREEAQLQAEEAQRQAGEAQQRAERLAAKLRELGIDPEVL